MDPGTVNSLREREQTLESIRHADQIWRRTDHAAQDVQVNQPRINRDPAKPDL